MDSTYKSEMFAEIVSLIQQNDEEMDILFSDRCEKEAFKATMKKRFDNLISDTDEVCFALCPHTSFLDAYHDMAEHRRVKELLNDFMKDKCEFTTAQRKKAMEQFDEFTHRVGDFRYANDRIDAIMFWRNYADMELGDVALRVFHMITSSASVERSFSMQKWFRGTQRNRIRADRMEKMLSIAFSDLDNVHAKAQRRPSRSRHAETAAADGGAGVHLITGPMDFAAAHNDDEFFETMNQQQQAQEKQPEAEEEGTSAKITDDEETNEDDDDVTYLMNAQEKEKRTIEDAEVVAVLPADAVVPSDDDEDDEPHFQQAINSLSSKPPPRKRSRLSKELNSNRSEFQ